MNNNQPINPFFPLKVEEVKTVESNKIVPRQAIINADTGDLVSVVSNRYNIVENEDLVNRFEKYLKDTDVNFVRTGEGVNGTGSRFWANYKFPEIKTNVGEYKTAFGTLSDDIELTIDIWNSYNGVSGVGEGVGGLRKVCLNGLIAKEKLFKLNERHTGIDDLIESFCLNFETAKTIFLDNLAPSWNDLKSANFEKTRAAVVLKNLELGKMYAKKMGYIYQQHLKGDQLKTMWDFYNMITWFTSHVMEQRSRRRAYDTCINASQQLLGEAVL